MLLCLVSTILSGLKTAVQKVACINGDIIYNDGFDMYDRHQDTYEFKSFDVIDLDKNKVVLKGILKYIQGKSISLAFLGY